METVRLTRTQMVALMASVLYTETKTVRSAVERAQAILKLAEQTTHEDGDIR